MKICGDIEGIFDDFWMRLVNFYAPTMVEQNKWNKNARRDLTVGDVVSVAHSDLNTFIFKTVYNTILVVLQEFVVIDKH